MLTCIKAIDVEKNTRKILRTFVISEYFTWVSLNSLVVSKWILIRIFTKAWFSQEKKCANRALNSIHQVLPDLKKAVFRFIKKEAKKLGGLSCIPNTEKINALVTNRQQFHLIYVNSIEKNCSVNVLIDFVCWNIDFMRALRWLIEPHECVFNLESLAERK